MAVDHLGATELGDAEQMVLDYIAKLETRLASALTERATLVEAARAVLAESSHDMPPSLGALDALRNALSETTNG